MVYCLRSERLMRSIEKAIRRSKKLLQCPALIRQSQLEILTVVVL
jgi:hypothetical protein